MNKAKKTLASRNKTSSQLTSQKLTLILRASEQACFSIGQFGLAIQAALLTHDVPETSDNDNNNNDNNNLGRLKVSLKCEEEEADED